MTQSRVFVVQEPLKRDAATGTMVSAFNFGKAAAYGELRVILPSGQAALSPAPTIFRCREQLADFCDNDYLIAAGDPSAIAIAVAVAASINHGRFKLLKYDRDARAYIRVDVDIHGRRQLDTLTSGFNAAPIVAA